MTSNQDANSENSAHYEVDKPELLKNWKLKLLVLLMCVLSFYAGWQASRSYLVKECHLAGAIVTIENGTIFCERP